MSATLDSDMFARYYGGCPVLTAGGRTFPVEQHFLEDAYELTGYALDPVTKLACMGTYRAQVALWQLQACLHREHVQIDLSQQNQASAMSPL